jgi:hypothetical protein
VAIEAGRDKTADYPISTEITEGCKILTIQLISSMAPTHSITALAKIISISMSITLQLVSQENYKTAQSRQVETSQ